MGFVGGCRFVGDSDLRVELRVQGGEIHHLQPTMHGHDRDLGIYRPKLWFVVTNTNTNTNAEHNVFMDQASCQFLYGSLLLYSY